MLLRGCIEETEEMVGARKQLELQLREDEEQNLMLEHLMNRLDSVENKLQSTELTLTNSSQ
eukprot:CAMPEP_0201283168 /NCGR_PEP_ID=MMETSP1317-20130820/7804_1 /ASSEMBLY_ACC=CAM_ASM_000770 /TAXON_ID=187299 /ORGANISM="Undescribed Undescribed, Strain Undescribed" /LENGTH=60 /DNA_ID=CAMNT_0047598471 /DNA_START=313 /DNA_END=495 /DNA_ORIENTATION=+